MMAHMNTKRLIFFKSAALINYWLVLKLLTRFNTRFLKLNRKKTRLIYSKAPRLLERAFHGCYLTRRSHGRVGFLRLVRFKTKQLIEDGALPGIGRYSW